MSSKYKTSILNRYLADSVDAHDDQAAAVVRNPDESKTKTKPNESITNSQPSRKRSIEHTTSEKLISSDSRRSSQSPKKQKISTSQQSFDPTRPIIQGPPNFLLFPPFSPTVDQSFRPGMLI
jgi:hypothetical protein